MLSRKIILVLVVLSLILLYVGSRIKVIELGYEVSKLKSEISELVRTNNLLKSKVAQNRSASELARWAGKLGLTSPGSSQVLFLQE